MRDRPVSALHELNMRNHRKVYEALAKREREGRVSPTPPASRWDDHRDP